MTEKCERLRSLLKSFGSCLVAYSGGVDSVLLAFVAKEVLGSRALAVIADSPSLPRRELQEAIEVARRFAIPLRVVRTREFDNSEYLANPESRCFFCKTELFKELEPLARKEGFSVVVYGENASDVGDHRPGSQAAGDFHVRAPLKEIGLTKPEIRELSAKLGLPTADKPQMACLSSRIPHGEAVTEAKLRMIEEAENLLRDLGFYDVRVRHHELPHPNYNGQINNGGSSDPLKTQNSELKTLSLARIEVGRSEMPRFLDDELFSKVADGLKGIGYAHITLDLHGYRRGSLNASAHIKTLAQASPPLR